MRLLFAGLLSGVLGLLLIILFFAVEGAGQEFPSALLVRESLAPLVSLSLLVEIVSVLGLTIYRCSPWILRGLGARDDAEAVLLQKRLHGPVFIHAAYGSALLRRALVVADTGRLTLELLLSFFIAVAPLLLPKPRPASAAQPEPEDQEGRYNPALSALSAGWGIGWSILGLFGALAGGCLLALDEHYWSATEALLGSGMGGLGMVVAGPLMPLMIPACACAVIRCVIVDRDHLLVLVHLALLQSLNVALSSAGEFTLPVLVLGVIVVALDGWIVWSLRQAASAGRELPVGFIRRTNGFIAAFALFLVVYAFLYVARAESKGLFAEPYSLVMRCLVSGVTVVPCAFLLCFAAIDTRRSFKTRDT